MSPHLQIASDGLQLPVDSEPFIWIPTDITSESQKFKGRVLCQDLCPSIQIPFPPAAGVSNLFSKMIDLLETCTEHNFMSCLLALGCFVQSFHYTSIVRLFGGCPITVLRGPPETGKSKTILCALSLIGSTVSSYYVKGTNAYFIDRSAESTLPYGIDDPLLKGTAASSKTNCLDLKEVIVDLYNGAKSANATEGSKTPLSVPFVATNFDMGNDSRYTSRANVISFELPSVGPQTVIEQEAYTALTAAIHDHVFSPCIGWVIRQMAELETDMNNGDDSYLAHIKLVLEDSFCNAPRSQVGWAVALFFTKKLLTVCRREDSYPDLERFVVTCVATQSVYSSSQDVKTNRPDLSPEGVVTTTLDEMLTKVKDLTKKERLAFIRVDTCIDKLPVLTVSLSHIQQKLTHTQRVINTALKDNPSLGYSSSAGYIREFLNPSATTTTITPKSNDNTRKRVTAFFLSFVEEKFDISFLKGDTAEDLSRTQPQQSIPLAQQSQTDEPQQSHTDQPPLIQQSQTDEPPLIQQSQTNEPQQSQTDEPPLIQQSQTNEPQQSQTDEPPLIQQSQTNEPQQSQTDEPPLIQQSQTNEPQQSQTDEPPLIQQSQTEEHQKSQTDVPPLIQQSQTEDLQRSKNDQPPLIQQSQTEELQKSQTEGPLQSKTDKLHPIKCKKSIHPVILSSPKPKDPVRVR